MDEILGIDARMVVAIWRNGKLSAAARKLGVSAATVTRRLGELERELGVVLFERSTRSLEVTPAGRELAIRLEGALQQVEDAIRLLREEDGELTGTVRASVPPNLAPVLAPMLARFYTDNPAVRVSLRATEHRLNYLAEGIDVLLRVGELQDDSLVAKPLLRYPHVLCGTTAWRRKLRTPIDLKQVPVAMWGTTADFQKGWVFEKGKDQIRVEPSPFLETNDYEVVRSLLLSGQAVGELPGILAAAMIESKELVRLLPRWSLPEVELSVLYPAHRLLPRAVRAFIEHVTSEFKALRA